MPHGAVELADLVENEIVQRRETGHDVTAVERAFKEVPAGASSDAQPRCSTNSTHSPRRPTGRTRNPPRGTTSPRR